MVRPLADDAPSRRVDASSPLSRSESASMRVWLPRLFGGACDGEVGDTLVVAWSLWATFGPRGAEDYAVWQSRGTSHIEVKWLDYSFQLGWNDHCVDERASTPTECHETEKYPRPFGPVNCVMTGPNCVD